MINQFAKGNIITKSKKSFVAPKKIKKSVTEEKLDKNQKKNLIDHFQTG